MEIFDESYDFIEEFRNRYESGTLDPSFGLNVTEARKINESYLKWLETLQMQGIISVRGKDLDEAAEEVKNTNADLLDFRLGNLTLNISSHQKFQEIGDTTQPGIESLKKSVENLVGGYEQSFKVEAMRVTKLMVNKKGQLIWAKVDVAIEFADNTLAMQEYSIRYDTRDSHYYLYGDHENLRLSEALDRHETNQKHKGN